MSSFNKQFFFLIIKRLNARDIQFRYTIKISEPIRKRILNLIYSIYRRNLS